MPDPVRSKPLIIAHRGVSAHAPENTRTAILMAIDSGADGVEFDVQLARDGVPVVIHDDTLFRTARRRERIAELTSRQLASVDVGSWFNKKYPARARPEFSRERVPTLDNVLTSLHGFAGRIFIELKCDQTNFRPLTQAVCELVRERDFLPKIVIKSFKLAAISEVRHLMPEVNTAALFAPEIMHYLRRREHIISLAREFDAGQLSVHYSLVTPRLASLASDAEMPLTVWTVDDPKWLLRRRSLSIDALVTNDPERFLSPEIETFRRSAAGPGLRRR